MGLKIQGHTMPAGPAARKKTIVTSTGIIAPALHAMGKNDTVKKNIMPVGLHSWPFTRKR